MISDCRSRCRAWRNCEITVPGEVVEKHGVTIVGTANLPSELAYNASQAYSKNLTNLRFW
ncbi:MAG: hypothetical protein R3C26_06670 [Calditrichia bacterium]